ncbi:MAG: hypothetical protein ABL985_01890 [Casimicrobium sp.]
MVEIRQMVLSFAATEGDEFAITTGNGASQHAELAQGGLVSGILAEDIARPI